MNLTAQLNRLSPAQAMWGPHLLMPAGATLGVVSSGIWNGILPFSAELDVEQQETTEAQNPLDVKGGDKPREFSIDIQVSTLATGQSPVTVYNAWQRDQGKSYYFFVGALPIDDSQYILREIEYSHTYFDTAADGSPIRADMRLTFVEDTILSIVSKEEKEPSDAAKKKSPKAQKAPVADFDLKKFVKANNL